MWVHDDTVPIPLSSQHALLNVLSMDVNLASSKDPALCDLISALRLVLMFPSLGFTMQGLVGVIRLSFRSCTKDPVEGLRRVEVCTQPHPNCLP